MAVVGLLIAGASTALARQILFDNQAQTLLRAFPPLG